MFRAAVLAILLFASPGAFAQNEAGDGDLSSRNTATSETDRTVQDDGAMSAPDGSATIGTAGAEAQVLATGSCEVSVEPDQLRVTVSFVAEADAGWQTVDITNARMAEARAAVQALDLPDLAMEAGRTAIAPDAVPGNGGERVTGYTGRITLVVTTPALERLGAVVEALLAGGATNLVEAGRVVSTGLRRSAEGECLAEAVGNARARAERIAGSLGMALGTVVSVNDSGLSAPPSPRGALLGDQLARLGGDVPASLDRHTIRGTVSAIFALVPASGGEQ